MFVKKFANWLTSLRICILLVPKKLINVLNDLIFFVYIRNTQNCMLIYQNFFKLLV
jgi:hypothetical protein